MLNRVICKWCDSKPKYQRKVPRVVGIFGRNYPRKGFDDEFVGKIGNDFGFEYLTRRNCLNPKVTEK